MKIKMFYQSLVSDWNHGNAHFLRGVVKELLTLGEDVEVFEPEDGWCLQQLIKDKNEDSIVGFHAYYPRLTSTFYSLEKLDVNEVLKDADLVIVHEFNDPKLVKLIGDYRGNHEHFKLLFHDTHHRSVSQPEEMRRYDLTHYDGVLAFGEVIKNLYLAQRWTQQAWTFHEAADTDLFRPLDLPKKGDVVWIGNWGDDERSREIVEYLIDPIRELGLTATIYGVRYPEKAIKKLEEAGIHYGGYLPNYKVPEVFAQHRVTLHVPRKYYTHHLPGIPTIRPFEAMACGIPLICAPWKDEEHLFRPGQDFLLASGKAEVKAHLKKILSDDNFARELASNGLQSIRDRHTCKHRTRELLNICQSINIPQVNSFLING